MKKYFSNIRTLAALLMAGAAFAACSSSDDSINEPRPATPVGEQVYKLTIKASNGNDATRALSLDGSGKLSASWTVGDVLSVSKDGTPLTSTLECTVANGDEATFTGTIQGTVSPDDNLTLTYHPVTGYSAFGNQDGTLSGNTNSAENYDIATAVVTVESVDGENNISIKETTVDFTTQSAMMKLTLTSDGTTAINATSLTVSAASVDVFTLTIPEATYTANGDGILYFALPSVANMASRLAAELSIPEETATTMLASATITFTASEGAATYTATKSGYPFAGGTYYRSTLTMAKTSVNLSKLAGAYTAQDGDVLTGTLDGNSQPYKVTIASGATVTLNNLTINGVHNNKYSWAGLTCEGNATIILAEGSTNSVTGFYRSRPGIEAGPTGTTLIIKGTGKLIASSQSGGSGNGPGIGSDLKGTCGNIEIQGGDITAKIGNTLGTSAGIGSSMGGTCGNITISGGTVAATGGRQSAGIGSGSYGHCGNITIRGGTVIATGGTQAGGIGSGGGTSLGGSTCGNITISGGTVTASSSTAGTGIGVGYGTSRGTSVCGDIIISGGSVTATGKRSGIGTGSQYCECGSITITSDAASVVATRGQSDVSHIGAGGSTGITCGTVTIDGVVNATTESSFTHFASTVSGNTWTLTKTE
jgi:hypothetical protein